MRFAIICASLLAVAVLLGLVFRTMTPEKRSARPGDDHDRSRALNSRTGDEPPVVGRVAVGTVLGRFGEPIHDARIIIGDVATRTSTEGRFSLAWSKDTATNARIIHESYEPRLVPLPRPQSRVLDLGIIRLDGLDRLRVQVVDSHGRAASGVRVTWRVGLQGVTGTLPRSPRKDFRVSMRGSSSWNRTNADGRTEFLHLARAPIVLVLDAAGQYQVEGPIPLPRHGSVVVTLHEGIRLLVDVVPRPRDPSDLAFTLAALGTHPMAAVPLELRPEALPWSVRLASGEYQLNALLKGLHAGGATVRLDEDASVTLPLAALQGFSVRAWHGAEPVQSFDARAVLSSARSLPANSSLFFLFRRGTIPAASGAAVVYHPAHSGRASYSVLVRAEGFRLAAVKVGVPTLTTDPIPVRVQLAKSATVRGEISNAPPGSTVMLALLRHAASGNNWSPEFAPVIARSQVVARRYDLQSCGAGTYTLQIRCPGRAVPIVFATLELPDSGIVERTDQLHAATLVLTSRATGKPIPDTIARQFKNGSIGSIVYGEAIKLRGVRWTMLEPGSYVVGWEADLRDGMATATAKPASEATTDERLQAVVVDPPESKVEWHGPSPPKRIDVGFDIPQALAGYALVATAVPLDGRRRRTVRQPWQPLSEEGRVRVDVREGSPHLLIVGAVVTDESRRRSVIVPVLVQERSNPLEWDGRRIEVPTPGRLRLSSQAGAVHEAHLVIRSAVLEHVLDWKRVELVPVGGSVLSAPLAPGRYSLRGRRYDPQTLKREEWEQPGISIASGEEQPLLVKPPGPRGR